MGLPGTWGCGWNSDLAWIRWAGITQNLWWPGRMHGEAFQDILYMLAFVHDTATPKVRVSRSAQAVLAQKGLA